MLVAGLALLGVALYYGYLTGSLGLRRPSRVVIDASWRWASAHR